MLSSRYRRQYRRHRLICSIPNLKFLRGQPFPTEGDLNEYLSSLLPWPATEPCNLDFRMANRAPFEYAKEEMQIPPPARWSLPLPWPAPVPAGGGDVFFGRDEQIDELLAKLDRSRFLAVVGTSGCGKSSLVRAGLIPALKTGALVSAGTEWPVATMRPGDQPMRNLARALIDDGVVDRPRGCGRAHARVPHRGRCGAGRSGWPRSCATRRHPEQKKLLLLVDQFEEIFRFRREGGRDEADAFVTRLLLASGRAGGRAGLRRPDMRSDYLGDCDLFAGLPEALNDSQFLTPRLTRDQRRGGDRGAGPGLRRPGRAGAGQPRCSTTWTAGPDQLPLMQHALMRLWKRAARPPRRRGPGPREVVLTLADYEAIGGLKIALSGHADEVYRRLDEGQRTDRRGALPRPERAQCRGPRHPATDPVAIGRGGGRCAGRAGRPRRRGLPPPRPQLPLPPPPARSSPRPSSTSATRA